MPKSKESLSLDKEIELYGIQIKKMPNGQYLKALETIKELPEEFMKELMQGRTDLKLSDMFDTKNIAMLVGTLLTSVPEFTIKFLSKLLNVSEKTLKEEISPLETIEIVEKFWEINNLTSFFKNEANYDEDNTFNNNSNWLQRTIAICVKIGISKREFMEDYYPDEIPIIMKEYAELNKVENKDEQEVGAEDF